MLVVAYLSLRNVSGRMQYDLSLLDKRVNQIVPFYILNISKSSFLPSPTSTHGSFFIDGMLQSTDFCKEWGISCLQTFLEKEGFIYNSHRKKLGRIRTCLKVFSMGIDFESIFNFRWSWKLIFVCNFFFIVCGLQRMHSIALTQSLKSSRNWRVESGEETCLYKTCREEFWNLPSARRSDSQIVHSQCLLSSEKTDNQSIHPPSLFFNADRVYKVVMRKITDTRSLGFFREM